MSNPDHLVLEALAGAGSDLSKPAHIVHYLYFPEREAAEEAAGVLSGAGFSVRTHLAPAGSIWKRLFGPREYSCIAETRAVPSEATIAAHRARMESVAGRFGGEYDGWEASVES